MKSLPPDLIQKLLQDEKTPQVQRGRRTADDHFKTTPSGIRPITPTRGPWRYKEQALKCVSKRCGVQTYMTFDGIPYCTVHGLQYLNDTCIKLTDRLEEAYKRRSENRVSVVGDLLGNYDEGDNMTDEGMENADAPTTGNQSEEEVAQIQSDEAESALADNSDSSDDDAASDSGDAEGSED